jgi:hypothetical protein
MRRHQAFPLAFVWRRHYTGGGHVGAESSSGGGGEGGIAGERMDSMMYGLDD